MILKNKDSLNDISFPQERKQRILLIALTIVVLVTLVILYFGFWRSSSTSVIPSSSQPALSPSTFSPSVGAVTDKKFFTEKIIEEIDFDADFLKNSSFQDLRVYGEWPLETEIKGRANPFLPY
jgi:hypothetical protein